MWKYLFVLLFVPGFLTYIIHHLVVAYFYKTQNLKKKYSGAEWALVTGGSSGIGKSLAFKLASQKLNVVLVALDDTLLDGTFEEIKAQFPNRQFRKVGVNLGAAPGEYLPAIIKATEDIQVQILFCNAGYMITGFFHTRSLDDLMSNLNCNAISGVSITHHFVQKMVESKLKGCVVFTSSAAACMPCPFSAQYGATKSFISVFGASLAAEVKPMGIDVLVFHPSPVATKFYDNAHKLDAIEFFKKFTVDPDELPDTVFASIGRTVYRDVGATAIVFRMVTKIIDYNFLATLITAFAKHMPDFKVAMAAASKQLDVAAVASKQLDVAAVGSIKKAL